MQNMGQLLLRLISGMVAGVSLGPQIPVSYLIRCRGRTIHDTFGWFYAVGESGAALTLESLACSRSEQREPVGATRLRVMYNCLGN